MTDSVASSEVIGWVTCMISTVLAGSFSSKCHINLTLPTTGTATSYYSHIAWYLYTSFDSPPLRPEKQNRTIQTFLRSMPGMDA